METQKGKDEVPGGSGKVPEDSKKPHALPTKLGELQAILQPLHDAPQTKEEIERILDGLRLQYDDLLGTLDYYQISPKGAPDWDAIEEALTLKVIESISKLKKPALLLIPPMDPGSMVDRINSRTGSGMKMERGRDNDLWNSGREEDYDKWAVSVVTGEREVKDDPTMQRGSYADTAQAWVDGYKANGIGVMDNARAYIALSMNGVRTGKPIDESTRTILNPTNLVEYSPTEHEEGRHPNPGVTSELAFGRTQDGDIVQLSTESGYNSTDFIDELRVRGMVKVI